MIKKIIILTILFLLYIVISEYISKSPGFQATVNIIKSSFPSF